MSYGMIRRTIRKSAFLGTFIKSLWQFYDI
jgi:hypothetical protein